ncbi:hypothetical protein [Photobacterium kishitanii]|uniref:Uncharacterized protein n=1 Tax=Photobacterium kishitanii TaxID=318456 RepID=A0A2T3KLY3_9GAMM|nr:hypothetical protein [Photobacterium kishitanii]PSV00712.1 hypothetical protein C9J27_06105 [Photobacterium kishitanii]
MLSKFIIDGNLRPSMSFVPNSPTKDHQTSVDKFTTEFIFELVEKNTEHQNNKHSVLGVICLDPEEPEKVGIYGINSASESATAHCLAWIKNHYSTMQSREIELELLYLDDNNIVTRDFCRLLYAEGIIDDAITDGFSSLITGKDTI